MDGEKIQVLTMAYADPPYPGMAHFYDCPEVDHRELVERLCGDYPDGWALSTASTTLKQVLAFCPDDVRVAAWIKPFCSFKKGVNPAYAWEPVIFRGGRRRTNGAEPTVRDWCAINITLRRGFVGAKPEGFCWWLFELMGLRPSDTFVDLFVGSGAVTRAWRSWTTERLPFDAIASQAEHDVVMTEAMQRPWRHETKGTNETERHA